MKDSIFLILYVVIGLSAFFVEVAILNFSILMILLSIIQISSSYYKIEYYNIGSYFSYISILILFARVIFDYYLSIN
jgi:hypothetical protein